MKWTTFEDVLKVVASAGNTTLVIDDVAVDHELANVFGAGLKQPISIIERKQGDGR